MSSSSTSVTPLIVPTGNHSTFPHTNLISINAATLILFKLFKGGNYAATLILFKLFKGGNYAS